MGSVAETLRRYGRLLHTLGDGRIWNVGSGGSSDRGPYSGEPSGPICDRILAGRRNRVYLPGGSQPVLRGQGAIVVQADDTQGFAYALERLCKQSGCF